MNDVTNPEVIRCACGVAWQAEQGACCPSCLRPMPVSAPEAGGNAAAGRQAPQDAQTPDSNRLTCANMRWAEVETCDRPVAMIDGRGFVYCAACGVRRRESGVRCRKLTAGELRTLRAGEAIWYDPARNRKPARCTDSPACARLGCDDCARSYGPAVRR